MEDKNIKVVTGPVHSGKTTRLFTFLTLHKSVDGILVPIVNGKRKLYHISSRTIKTLETDNISSETVPVGKYHFLLKSFDWANENLITSFKNFPEWLIIDEIGKLELKGEGLHKSVSHILNNLNKTETKVILVIRDYLLNEALTFYNILQEDYNILEL